MIICHPRHPNHLFQDLDSISRTFLEQFALVKFFLNLFPFRQSREFLAKMKSENSEEGEEDKKKEEEEKEEPREKSEAELEAAKVQKKFMEMMLSEEGSEQEKESHLMILKGTSLDGDPAASKEKDKTGKTKESTDSDFDKIIGQRMEVPVCNYGPDCR